MSVSGEILHRAAWFAGLACLAAGAVVLTAAAAPAASGTEPASLSLNPSAGATAWAPGWVTRDGCPSGFRGSAVLYERSGETRDWVLRCFAGPGGTRGWVWRRPPKPRATTTKLTAAPNPAPAGATVTLTATVSAADGTIPHGEVLFFAGRTFISITRLNASGVATATTAFALPRRDPAPLSLSAYFVGSNPFYARSVGSYSETVIPAGVLGAGSESITATVPPSGAFTVTITPGTVVLTAPNRMVARGMLRDVTVTDTRNYHPGWSVSGQASAFTGSGTAADRAIPGDQLGWIPRGVRPLRDATLGPAVAPAAPGLGTTSAVLASAAAGHGFGAYVLTAALYLAIPHAATPGPYDGDLTVTAVAAGP